MCTVINISIAAEADHHVDRFRPWFQQRNAFRPSVSLSLRSDAKGIPAAKQYQRLIHPQAG
jgi:hypothetical protein